ncbi:molybdopterin molybdotransferase MoeA [Paenibacillus sp. HN-1]|uniref:molybdopterin molybdotransferase MoeA n=1 Tax=Paenibacillus TaxID=44249 RepID=UPI001CA7C39C|nr:MULTISPECIES: gephyrin-like molybdotransferase Glp [Paenibacillus]MBY9082097.1 molybdopterin molybdotransferase MoeA [Paenibacillus sp. CGMCC 1.18879]MBY9085745.1 molybdopterin molybdotransferase MoeA [Paenibacillus sinensis]
MEETTKNGKFGRKVVQVHEAQQKLLAYASPLEMERIPIGHAAGRRLAEDIAAPHPFPAFNRSGMDGYAVIAADTIAAKEGEIVWLKVVDEIPCGFVSEMIVTQGTAARIMTGAQVPEGADAVVMLEATTTREEDGVSWVGVRATIQAGRNITPRGFEIRSGDKVLEAGRRIGAGDIAVLATFGIAEVPVIRRPKVALFATGSELLGVGDPLQPGKIRDSNSPMLEVLIREAGGEPVMLGAIADNLELARAKVEMALEAYDLVITIGGVSVGDYDIMGDLIREDPGAMLFNKVAMRPGSVTTAAVRGGTPIIALSGNPGACFVGFHLFAYPMLAVMQGSSSPLLPEGVAVLAEDYHKVNNFTRFVRARLELQDGVVHAYPASIDESSVMVTIKDSDCLLVVTPDERGLRAGTKVRYIKLP